MVSSLSSFSFSVSTTILFCSTLSSIDCSASLLSFSSSSFFLRCTSSTCICNSFTSLSNLFATPALSRVNNLSLAITISNGRSTCLIKCTMSAHSNCPMILLRKSIPPTSKMVSPASRKPLFGPSRGSFSSALNGLKGVTCNICTTPSVGERWSFTPSD